MNQNFKKTILLGGAGVLGISSIAALVFSLQPAWAFLENQPGTGVCPNYNPERHDRIEKALENNDYNAWKEAMSGKGKVIEIINENNFSKFAEMHKLMREGKTEEAKTIREDLGLGQGKGAGMGRGFMKGKRGCNCGMGNK